MKLKTAKLSGSHNLPYQLTGFIGREQELAQLATLLEQHRLITLTGIGGVGKTRLALQTAERAIEHFEGGVWLVELATLADPLLITATLCQTLKLLEQPGQPLLTTLIGFLQTQEILLVLDNCEHLVAECAQLADQLLKACPTLTILATSREALNIGGETIFHVSALTLPKLGDNNLENDWQTLSHYAAIQLFVSHARLFQTEFDLTAQNVETVLQICQRLDGIPLALELAAARLRGLGLEQLALRLDDRFRLLTGGSRTAQPRQQTLQALLDWSYNLLTEPEKAVLRRLAVFVGDFSLEAAETVCAADEQTAIAPEQVLDLVWQLVNKSLIVMEEVAAEQNPASGLTRYRLLETIREYGKTKLLEANEFEQTTDKHYEWYAQLAQKAAQHVGGTHQTVWFNRLEQEHDNLRAALDWLVKNTRTEEATRLALNLWVFWQSRNYTREGQRRLKEILALDEKPGILRPRLLHALGTLSHNLRLFEEAHGYQTQALNLWSKQADKKGLASALVELSWQHFEEMKLEQARQYARESLAIAREIEDKPAIAAASFIYGLATHEAHLEEGVVEALEESQAIWRALDDKANLVSALGTLAKVKTLEGNYDLGRSLLAEATTLQMTHGNIQNFVALFAPLLMLAVYGPGGIDMRRYAARVLGVMVALTQKTGDAPDPWQSEIDKYSQIVTAQIGEAIFQQEFENGLKMSLPDAFALARLITDTESTEPAASSPISYPNRLTEREIEVLKLVAVGYSNPQIAETLMLSRKTVEAHLRSIFAKIEVTSRTAAARYALENGLA